MFGITRIRLFRDMEIYNDVLPREQSFDGFAVDSDLPGAGRRRLLLDARRILGETGEPPMILLAPADRGPATP